MCCEPYILLNESENERRNHRTTGVDGRRNRCRVVEWCERWLWFPERVGAESAIKILALFLRTIRIYFIIEPRLSADNYRVPGGGESRPNGLFRSEKYYP